MADHGVIVLQVLDSGLHNAGVPYSYGFAIILLTILVKLATYPLSKQQVRSRLSCSREHCLCCSHAISICIFDKNCCAHLSLVMNAYVASCDAALILLR